KIAVLNRRRFRHGGGEVVLAARRVLRRFVRGGHRRGGRLNGSKRLVFRRIRREVVLCRIGFRCRRLVVIRKADRRSLVHVRGAAYMQYQQHKDRHCRKQRQPENRRRTAPSAAPPLLSRCTRRCPGRVGRNAVFHCTHLQSCLSYY